MLALLRIVLLLLLLPSTAFAQEGTVTSQSLPPLQQPASAPVDLPASEETPVLPEHETKGAPASGATIVVQEPTPATQQKGTAHTAKSGKASAKSKKGTSETKPAEDENIGKDPNTVVLQGLNKVTGHISKLDAPLGTVMRFGTLEIIARRCWKAPPEERPENAALLEIRELKPGEGPHDIFLGWMFSSSPGLSALEHPVYDVNVLSCEYRSDPEKKENVTEKSDKKDAPASKSEKKEPKK